MKHTKKLFRIYKELILFVMILLICGLGFILAIVPFIKKTIVLGTDSRSGSKSVEMLKNKLSILETIDEDDLRENLQTLLSAVPSDKSLSSLLNTIDGLTAQTGVSLGSLTLTKLGSLATESAERLTTDEHNLGTNIIPFTISISGSLDQIRAFISMSVTVRRLFRIRTFTVSFPGVKSLSDTNSETNVDGNRVLSTIEMDAFYSPVTSSIGSVSEPVSVLSDSDIDVISKVSAMRNIAPAASILPAPAPGAGKEDPFSL